MNSGYIDKVSLLSVIKELCTKKIRTPITMEQAKLWLKQFKTEEEYFLGLLILRYLIFRTNKQLNSSLKQALKSAALHFLPSTNDKHSVDWKSILNGEVNNLNFIFGPPKQSAARPGKSGEIISRQLKECDKSISFNLMYYSEFKVLEKNQRYLIVDDGTFTGDQLSEFLSNEVKHLKDGGQCGIVVGLAHEEAIKKLKENHPNVPVFFGEKITKSECFEGICNNWVEDGVWPFPETHPFCLYKTIWKNAGFIDRCPLGYGELGCLVAYEHGIPDNSIQLLWGQSKKWNPLIQR